MRPAETIEAISDEVPGRIARLCAALSDVVDGAAVDNCTTHDVVFTMLGAALGIGIADLGWDPGTATDTAHTIAHAIADKCRHLRRSADREAASH